MRPPPRLSTALLSLSTDGCPLETRPKFIPSRANRGRPDSTTWLRRPPRIEHSTDEAERASHKALMVKGRTASFLFDFCAQKR